MYMMVGKTERGAIHVYIMQRLSASRNLGCVGFVVDYGLMGLLPCCSLMEGVKPKC
ncbi:hypothetical protein Hanom_Chr15g01384921 [Helianthus anomalus]